MAWICGKCIFTVYVKMVPSALLIEKDVAVGSLAERLARSTGNSEAGSSSPALTARWICSL